MKVYEKCWLLQRFVVSNWIRIIQCAFLNKKINWGKIQHSSIITSPHTHTHPLSDETSKSPTLLHRAFASRFFHSHPTRQHKCTPRQPIKFVQITIAWWTLWCNSVLCTLSCVDNLVKNINFYQPFRQKNKQNLVGRELSCESLS